ncbi:MAG: tryptophan synthase subunit alpha [Spirochaetales bacterium]|nr:tryptophan synthase subunit alpha [Spirochaetales bacterium]
MAEKNIIMTHLVAGYPDLEESRRAALAMVAGGASYLEVQFPFSDPIADGPLIQGACTDALNSGFSTDKGFDFLSSLTAETDVPVFLMTYANLLMAPGVEVFVGRAAKSGASGLIIPDLPYDYDEGLYKAGEMADIPVVPVVIPGIDEERLKAILAMKPPYIYTAVRKGITGARTTIEEETVRFLDRLSRSGAKVLAGFGIREKEQVDLLSRHVHGSVVGSALVEIIGRCAGENRDCSGDVKAFVESLLKP